MLPSFLIIGAAKAGTTSLYHYLRQHPDIYMSPIKESNYFALKDEKPAFNGPGDMDYIGSFSITRQSDYEALFSDALPGQAIGEASPYYLYSTRAADNIRQYLPEARLICILRNPVERAYSQYLMFRRDNREPVTSFSKVLKLEQQRMADGWEWAWNYKAVGRYGEQLSRYRYALDRGKLKVFLYEDLLEDPQKLLETIFRFIGVNPAVDIDTTKHYNVMGYVRNEMLLNLATVKTPFKSLVNRFIPGFIGKRLRKKIMKLDTKLPSIPSKVRRDLTGYYREDILRLEGLIQRDLSHWLDQGD